MATYQSDILVVGAGIAGLMAARRLCAAGFQVAVVEKCSGAGGRLSTVPLGSGLADSGAQFFTVRTLEFRREVDSWLAEGLVYEWSRGWEFGDTWRSRAVIMTPPVTQSLRLLEDGEVYLPENERVTLRSIRYAPCLCGLFLIDGRSRLPRPGALQRPGEAISWVGDNDAKGISPGARVLTVHASPVASDERWASDDAAVLRWMYGEIAPWIDTGTGLIASRLERWQYAVPVDIYPDRCFPSAHKGLLVFAGDAFDGPRVEGAALSGWAAAEAVIARL
ncbi:MAG: hypothetical protein DCC51_13750 [Anaerolineae bacterium]|nr:MAG: hypothetical protein DCC51_13750 [Anaerolineae bacterium]